MPQLGSARLGTFIARLGLSLENSSSNSSLLNGVCNGASLPDPKECANPITVTRIFPHYLKGSKSPVFVFELLLQNLPSAKCFFCIPNRKRYHSRIEVLQSCSGVFCVSFLVSENLRGLRRNSKQNWALFMS